ncbi:MAG: iron uptake porin, partial [Microcystaceae cyanobacterium]
LLQENVAVLQEDLDTLKRLAEEFETELAALGVRIDNLESRVAFLEEHQFSPTTNLTGETIAVVSGVWGQETASLSQPKGTSISDGQVAVNYRNRLEFNSSFSGRDRLRVRFQTANFKFGRAGSNLTDFNFSAGGDSRVRVNKLQYRFPVGDKFTFIAAGTKITMDDLADPLAPYTSSFTTGSIAFFPALAPIYLVNDFTGPGLGATYNFTDSLNLSFLYSAGAGNDPAEGKGLFNGEYTTGAQLNFQPSGNTGLGFAYLHEYIPSGQLGDFPLLGFTGVANSDNPFDGNATTSDHFAFLWTWQVFERFNLSGWGMYSNAKGQGGARDGDVADIWNWKFSFSFPDLLAEGNLGVVSVGSPPYAARLTNRNNVDTNIVQTFDTPLMVETFYVWQLNDNISLSPGFWVSLNPENDRSPLWVGALRTSFEF